MKITLLLCGLAVAAQISHGYFNLLNDQPSPFIFQYFEPSSTYTTQAGFGNVGLSTGTQINYNQDIMYQQAYWYRSKVNGVQDYREYQVCQYIDQKVIGGSVIQTALQDAFSLRSGLQFIVRYNIYPVSADQCYVLVNTQVKNVASKAIQVDFYPYEDLQTSPVSPQNDKVAWDASQSLFTYTNPGAGTNVATYRALTEAPIAYEAGKYTSLRGDLANNIVDEFLSSFVPAQAQDYATAMQYRFTLQPGESRQYDFGVGYNIVTPMPSRVNANMNVQGWVGGPGYTATYELRDPGTGQTIEGGIGNFAADGKFWFTTGHSGTFDIAVKGEKHLRTVIRDVTLVSNTSTNIAGTLLSGDVNGDNAVNTDDYLLINENFDLNVGDFPWDGRADLNGDGTTNTDDYLLLSDNFDLVGED